MKKIIFTLFILGGSIAGLNAQTKGTNTISLGVSTLSSESTAGPFKSTNDATLLSVGLGHFIKDNAKIGVSFSYSTEKNTSSAGSAPLKGKGYLGGLSYQHYYPLFSKFYAFAGASATYAYQKTDLSLTSTVTEDTYSAGGFGGLTYFVSRHFAFETNLLAATVGYQKSKEHNSSSSMVTTTRLFDLTTTGFITNLGFSIQFLF
jgi:hypothetical protein